MSLSIATPPAIQDLKLASKATLGSANATITATIPSGYRYLRVVLYGVTTGDTGVGSRLKLLINGAVTNYRSRSWYVLTTTFGADAGSITDGIAVGAPQVGVAMRFMMTADIIAPINSKKMITGEGAATEEGTETSTNRFFFMGESDETADVTSISIVLPASTWTTATELRVYGGEN